MTDVVRRGRHGLRKHAAGGVKILAERRVAGVNARMLTPRRRDPQLQDFLDAAQTTLALAAPPRGVVVSAAVERLFSRLARVGPAAAPAKAPRPPAHRVLESALGLAREASPALSVLADHLERLDPRLEWKRSTRERAPDTMLADGYCGAIVVGADGLEQRDDVRIGISLMAPGVTYPDHRHPPEEIYIALSGGEWRQNAEPWHAPGRGGLVHNPPDIVHAMRATAAPLLAVWFLIIDDPNGE